MTPDLRALRAVEHRDVDGLTQRWDRVGLDGVLQDLDRAAEPCAVPGDAAGDGFTWEPRDRDDPTWWSQGIASTRDGDVLLVSWYAKRDRLGRTPGSRVTVVDRTDPGRPRYRHLRLVVPRRFSRTGRVPVHAGGIAVVGDRLWVADTFAGVRVFALSDVMRLRRSRRDGDAHVLPQVLRLRQSRGSGLRFSFLSVGDVQGRPSLVVGEYRRAGSPQLVRYPLDPSTGLPAFGPDGACPPLEVHHAQPTRMQGVAAHGSTWVVSASTGRGNAGDLLVGAPGAFTRHAGVLPPGPEDLDWSRPGERLWCSSEWPGRRWVFPVDLSRLNGP